MNSADPRMDDDTLAAEYVLGTLEHTDRLQAQQRLAEEDAFAARIRGWEARLQPLALAVPLVEPSQLCAGRIARSVRAQGHRDDNRSPAGRAEAIVDDNAARIATPDMARALAHGRYRGMPRLGDAERRTACGHPSAGSGGARGGARGKC